MTTQAQELDHKDGPSSMPAAPPANGVAPEVHLARALGWFSVGLGATAILAPRGLSRFAGVAARPVLMRTFGARELATGLGILQHRDRPAPWIWARVGGDLLDLGMLGLALRRSNGSRDRVGAAAAAVAGVTALDFLCGTRLQDTPASVRARGEHVRCTLRVNREPQHLYRFWRELPNLPRFMQQIQAVEAPSEGPSRWRALGPDGTVLSWEADVVADEPDRRIGWCSRPDAEVFHCGSILFAPPRSGPGTLVSLDLQVAWPHTGLVNRIASLLGAGTEQRVKQDLRRFKSLMETGEIATTEGQSSGRARTARA